MDLQAIFKAYDVRGMVPDELDEDAARRIGFAFARFADAESVVVGRDARTSSPLLAAALHDGIRAAGVRVIDLGMTPTDAVYFASGHFDCPGAVVTASHNPKGYNGIKMCLAGAAPVGAESGLVEIQSSAASNDPPASLTGAYRNEDIVDAYVDHVLRVSGAASIAGLRVGIDGGNGVAGVMIPSIFERIDAGLIGLYLDPDGTFPNHHPDPLRPENLVDLTSLIMREKPDFGVAFDGDADRIGVIDRDGAVVWGDRLLVLLARALLEEEPGATIIGEVKCSQTLYDDIAARGGRAIMGRTGHSLIKAKIKEEGALLAGEMSGHIFYAHRYYGFDDALFFFIG